MARQNSLNSRFCAQVRTCVPQYEGIRLLASQDDDTTPRHPNAKYRPVSTIQLGKEIVQVAGHAEGVPQQWQSGHLGNRLVLLLWGAPARLQVLVDCDAAPARHRRFSDCTASTRAPTRSSSRGLSTFSNTRQAAARPIRSASHGWGISSLKRIRMTRTLTSSALSLSTPG